MTPTGAIAFPGKQRQNQVSYNETGILSKSTQRNNRGNLGKRSGKRCTNPQTIRFVPLSGLIDQPVVNSVERKFEAVGNAQLVKNIVQVILHGLFANK